VFSARNSTAAAGSSAPDLGLPVPRQSDAAVCGQESYELTAWGPEGDSFGALVCYVHLQQDRSANHNAGVLAAEVLRSLAHVLAFALGIIN
jgi:hypothetical protein